MYFLPCESKIFNYVFKLNEMKKSYRLVSLAVIFTAFLAGCEDDPVPPTSDFTFDPAEITVYDEVTFTNASTGADTYAWDFGDGETSTEMNPVHIYKASGSYTVKLVASNADGDTESSKSLTVNDPNNYCTINGTEYIIDSEMYWDTPHMGGDPYIRVLTTASGQDNPDLLKLYPNKGLGELPGTYTWDSENPAGTYDSGYTFNYDGTTTYDSTAYGKTGSGDLVITELDAGVYKFEAEMAWSIGNWNWDPFEFIETSTADVKLEYIGGITPLP